MLNLSNIMLDLRKKPCHKIFSFQSDGRNMSENTNIVQNEVRKYGLSKQTRSFLNQPLAFFLMKLLYTYSTLGKSYLWALDMMVFKHITHKLLQIITGYQFNFKSLLRPAKKYLTVKNVTHCLSISRVFCVFSSFILFKMNPLAGFV